MKKFGKYILMSVAASTVLWTPTTYAEDEPIVVAGQSAISMWTEDGSDRLSSNFERARRPWRSSVPDGYAQVQFRCAEDGSPVDVQLITPSGSSWIDRSALRSVTRLRDLSPLPSNVADDQEFRADFIFASDRSAHDRVARKLEKANAQRMVPNDRTVIALLVTHSGG